MSQFETTVKGLKRQAETAADAMKEHPSGMPLFLQNLLILSKRAYSLAPAHIETERMHERRAAHYTGMVTGLCPHYRNGGGANGPTAPE